MPLQCLVPEGEGMLEQFYNEGVGWGGVGVGVKTWPKNYPEFLIPQYRMTLSGSSLNQSHHTTLFGIIGTLVEGSQWEGPQNAIEYRSVMSSFCKLFYSNLKTSS